MMAAATERPVAKITLIAPVPPAAASITWLFVTIVPSERRITPDPSPVPLEVVTTIVTTLGNAMAAALTSWPCEIAAAAAAACPDGAADEVAVVLPAKCSAIAAPALPPAVARAVAATRASRYLAGFEGRRAWRVAAAWLSAVRWLCGWRTTAPAGRVRAVRVCRARLVLF